MESRLVWTSKSTPQTQAHDVLPGLGRLQGPVEISDRFTRGLLSFLRHRIQSHAANLQ